MHLYQSWDDSYYLTEDFDGTEGHKLHLVGTTTVAEIHAIVGYKETVEVYRAMHGMHSSIEVFI